MSAEDPAFLSPELSLLAFQWRVLALAQDPRTPLLERLRFLAIVTSNIDEIYMVRMAELREAARAGHDPDTLPDEGDGLTPAARLQAVEAGLAALVDAQSACAADCLAAAELHDVRLVRWDDITDAERAALRDRCREEIHPGLAPMAVTRSPGVPLPHLPHLGLFIGIVYQTPGDARPHLVEHELPTDVPRLLPVPGRDGTLIPVEEVLRANAELLLPSADVDGVYLFRVTRGGELPLQDEDAGGLLDAVALATQRRPYNPAVRVEVEAGTPPPVAALILDNLHRDAAGRATAATVTEVQVVHGLLDLRCLPALPLPRGAGTEFPPMASCDGLNDDISMLDMMARGDILLHHPFDSFDDSVVRFFQDAAGDPAVTRIACTLYRVGSPSPIVEALVAAARAGRQVFALVELQARFDEEHNVQWARALEKAGGRVVYGLPGLKVHAKLALVERTEGGMAMRYAHIGTGNYNPRSGRQYTDLSLFTADPSLTRDVASVLDALAGAATPGRPPAGEVLVAPETLLPGVLERIERETAHAQAGRPARVTIKVNGLADREVVRALYRASQAGVQVDLVVRGICVLRPGVPGLSETIRVRSVVGRFLEHSRVYRFLNGGDPDYLIGSADLRPRNLRRRVEVLVPVRDPYYRELLDTLLERYLDDGTAWELDGTGRFTPRHGDTPSAQERYVADAFPVQ
ncbi:MAG: polyphosphate kinase 1 [Gemmatimonadaceae bacterium]|nr:polyphosphate kinase 1 [Gemmatimonadaceae bacterium]